MRTFTLIGLILCLGPLDLRSQEEQRPPGADHRYEGFFLGYEAEPDMEYGGRFLASIAASLSRVFAEKTQDKPGLQAAWEFPLGLVLMLVQHEVGGHGGRAREFHLDPSYGFGLDFSAYTSIDLAPETVEQLSLIAAGGTESDNVAAHRMALDFHRWEGAEGSKVPLFLFQKTDLTLYVSQTSKPRPGSGDDDFTSQYEDGNDIAVYLVSRQGQRQGANAEDLWNRDYLIDFGDPLLEDNFDEARAAALWNLLDPSLVGTLMSYFKQHLSEGQVRVRPWALEIGDSVRLSAGTRAALGPQSVTRFLDFYCSTPRFLANIYLRDLDSSVERTYGYGIRLHHLELGEAIALSLQFDTWDNPESLENLYLDSSVNHMVVELDMLLKGRFGLSAKVGHKDGHGFFPGTPAEDGTYAGFGLRFNW